MKLISHKVVDDVVGEINVMGSGDRMSWMMKTG
jgi:hypothetical protein